MTESHTSPSRKLRDISDEKKVVALLLQANVFNVNNQATIPERLQTMVLKDVATTRREESLLNANSLNWPGGANFLCEGKVCGAKRRWAS